MLGVFAKLPGAQPIKSRLQTRLTRSQAESFYVACLADVLETACRVEARPVLFLLDADAKARAGELLRRAGLPDAIWKRLEFQEQRGSDLGARLEAAFDFLAATGDRGAFVIGSDSPSLPASLLRRGLESLASADVALGPTPDGGYWSIGVRRPVPGLLEGIAWSTSSVLEETQARTRARGLKTTLLESWTDVDHPEDLRTLAGEIAALRAAGDRETARFSAAALTKLGFVDENWTWKATGF
jgi:rSAM/selenodomain-associated transferase 1